MACLTELTAVKTTSNTIQWLPKYAHTIQIIQKTLLTLGLSWDWQTYWKSSFYFQTHPPLPSPHVWCRSTSVPTCRGAIWAGNWLPLNKSGVYKILRDWLPFGVFPDYRSICWAATSSLWLTIKALLCYPLETCFRVSVSIAGHCCCPSTVIQWIQS